MFGIDKHFAFFALVYNKHNHAVDYNIQNPTYRPTVIQHLRRRICFASGVNPHDTEHADAEEIGEHWCERITHTAHTTDKHFDDTAHKIYRKNDFHSIASVLNDDGVLRVQFCDILPCGEQNERPNKADNNDHCRRFESGFLDTSGLFRAVILPRKRNGCV